MSGHRDSQLPAACEQCVNIQHIKPYRLWCFAPHFARLRSVYHKGTSNDTFVMNPTRLMWMRLNNLKPNSQYVVYVVAVTSVGASLPSETLVAWTEPALSAFVDVSTSRKIIKPITLAKSIDRFGFWCTCCPGASVFTKF